MFRSIFIAVLLFVCICTQIKAQKSCFDESAYPNKLIDSTLLILKHKLNNKGIDTLVLYEQSTYGIGLLSEWGVVLWKRNNACFARKIDVVSIKISGNLIRHKVVVRGKKRFNPYLVTSFKDQPVQQEVNKPDSNSSDSSNNRNNITINYSCDDCAFNVGILFCQYGKIERCYMGAIQRFDQLQNKFARAPLKHLPLQHRHKGEGFGG
jgi:hypothetical protein